MRLIFDLYNSIKADKLTTQFRASLDGVYKRDHRYLVTNGHFLISWPTPITDERNNVLLKPDSKTLTITETPGEYPDPHKLLDSHKNGTQTICLNPDYLQRICKLLGQAKGKDRWVDITFTQTSPDRNPVKITCSVEGVEAIIMPIQRD